MTATHVLEHRGVAPSKGRNIAIWVVSILLALLYLQAGVTKLIGVDAAVQGFQKAGYPDAFRLFIGAAETAGAIGLLVPRVRLWAAIGLEFIMLGALYTHIKMHDPVANMIPAALALVLLVVITVVHWPSKRVA